MDANNTISEIKQIFIKFDMGKLSALDTMKHIVILVTQHMKYTNSLNKSEDKQNENE